MLIFDWSWTKDILFAVAREQVKEFYRLNNLPDPAGVMDKKGLPGGLYGDCFGGFIRVDVTKSVWPQRNRGRVWSFPGHKSDLTAAGILAHEIGHHVAAERGLKGWSKVVNMTKMVSSYEPDNEEAFAESFRIFLLNPELLRQGRPERYFFMVHGQGLTPVHHEEWTTVLQNAPQHIRDAAGKFCIGQYERE